MDPPRVPSKDQQPVRGGRLVFAVVGEPATLDPYSTDASDLTRALVHPIYPSLFEFDSSGIPRHSLSASLRRVRRGAVIRLRRALWSDGRRITARDVAASVARARPPSGFAGLRAVVRDPRRVLLIGRASWRRRLARAAYVLPRGRADRGVSGGPFRMTRVVPGLQVSYVPNPRWWGEVPLLDRLVVRHVQSLDLLLELMRRGDLDAGWPPSSVNLRDRLDSLGLEHASVQGWERLELELDEARFSAAERRWLNAHIDRRALDEGLLRDAGTPLRSTSPGPLRRPSGVLQVAASAGDELAMLIQRALFRQLYHEDLELELLTVDERTFYGRWDAEARTDVAIRRRSGAPGARLRTGAAASLPLARVATFIAWRRGVRGIEVNGTIAGPLADARTWWLDP